MTRLAPKPYQLDAAKFAYKKKCCALFIDPGMGKTAIALMLVSKLKQKEKIRKVLIVASLNIIYETWPDELKKWDQFRDLTYTILHGPKKNSNLDLNRDIYLINPEGLASLLESYYDFDMLIIDESSKFKNSASQRFKALKKELPLFTYRLIMSGTPAPNSLEDMFSQMYIVDRGAAFGKFVTHFRERYYYYEHRYSYTPILKPGSAKAIQKKIRRLAYVLKNKSIEKPIFNYVRVRMPPGVQKQYNTMEAELFAEIDNNEKVLAMSAASAYGKCHQIANGALYKPESTDYYPLHKSKLEAARELSEELQGKPLLIGYKFKHDLAQLKTIFPKAPHIGGGVPMSKRKQIRDQWNKGKVQILLGQVGAISHGLNLQYSGCKDVCYFSLTDDLDAYEQFYRRVYGRHGSKKFIRVHHIIAKDTVDEAILLRNKAKDKQQLTMLEAIQKYRKYRESKKAEL